MGLNLDRRAILTAAVPIVDTSKEVRVLSELL